MLQGVHRFMAASKKFTDFKVICNARVPIIKCLHIGSGLECDINFTSSVGVYNSRIMAHLFRFDPRIHKLAIVIKFWMKCHNLFASNAKTSYSALWLVIFYLQQLDMPLLPPIEVFQRDVPEFFVGAANLSFNFELSNVLTKNEDRILTLLHGFFTFYAKFDFGTQLISPLHGRAFPRNCFESSFPHHFARYRETLTLYPTLEPLRFGKPICIQDPFEICRSIPGKLNGIYYQTFRTALANAAQICRDKLTTTGGTKELLLALFNSEVIMPKEPANYFIVTKNGQGNMNITITAMANEIEVITEYLRRNHPNASPSNEDINQLWVKICISFLCDMLQDIFAFHLGDGQDSDSDFSKSLDMIATKNVFVKRKQMKQPLPNINVEMKRTKRKLKKRNEKLYAIPLRINCRIWADLEDDLTVFVNIIDRDKNPLIDSFYLQFKNRARQLINAYFAGQKFGISLASTTTKTLNAEKKVE